MKKKTYFKRWGLEWFSKNKLDGERTHLIFDDNCLPALFPTRKKAREYADKNYGYIKFGKDLRQEPHGWRMPKPVKIISIEYERR